MVRLPEGFVSTKYPGYFWNIQEQHLYSIKIGGILKPLKLYKANHFNKWTSDGYNVTVNGRRKALLECYLLELTDTDSVITVENRDIKKDR